jgi:RimJ/RimL family protein N-acetyltransferase
MNINFDYDYKLENRKVVLRPLTYSDKPNLLPFSVNEAELWKYSLQSASREENLEKYIKTALEARSREQEYPFIVLDKQSNTYAGCTRFYDIQLSLSTLQLGYTWYGKKFQGTKVNKNCKYLLLEFAFETLGAERVEFRADKDNARSIAAMQSIGCKVEGILRSDMPKRNGGRRDSMVLSILKNEWFESVKENLFNRL